MTPGAESQAKPAVPVPNQGFSRSCPSSTRYELPYLLQAQPLAANSRTFSKASPDTAHDSRNMNSKLPSHSSQRNTPVNRSHVLENYQNQNGVQSPPYFSPPQSGPLAQQCFTRSPYSDPRFAHQTLHSGSDSVQVVKSHEGNDQRLWNGTYQEASFHKDPVAMHSRANLTARPSTPLQLLGQPLIRPSVGEINSHFPLSSSAPIQSDCPGTYSVFNNGYDGNYDTPQYRESKQQVRPHGRGRPAMVATANTAMIATNSVEEEDAAPLLIAAAAAAAEAAVAEPVSAEFVHGSDGALNISGASALQNQNEVEHVGSSMDKFRNTAFVLAESGKTADQNAAEVNNKIAEETTGSGNELQEPVRGRRKSRGRGRGRGSCFSQNRRQASVGTGNTASVSRGRKRKRISNDDGSEDSNDGSGKEANSPPLLGEDRDDRSEDTDEESDSEEGEDDEDDGGDDDYKLPGDEIKIGASPPMATRRRSRRVFSQKQKALIPTVNSPKLRRSKRASVVSNRRLVKRFAGAEDVNEDEAKESDVDMGDDERKCRHEERNDEKYSDIEDGTKFCLQKMKNTLLVVYKALNEDEESINWLHGNVSLAVLKAEIERCRLELEMRRIKSAEHDREKLEAMEKQFSMSEKDWKNSERIWIESQEAECKRAAEERQVLREQFAEVVNRLPHIFNRHFDRAVDNGGA